MIDNVEDLFKIHYSRNPHHWQYWLDDTGEPDYTRHSEEQIDEPIMIAYIEMLCDWASFSIKKNNPNELREWYISNKPTMKLYQAEQQQIEDLLNEFVENYKGGK